MSLIKANAVQVGQSPTATQNFTLAVPSSPDGTIKLTRKAFLADLVIPSSLTLLIAIICSRP